MSGGCKVHKEQFTTKWQLKFIAMIIFTALLFIMKVVIGHISNSMALVADAFHMVADFAALTIGYIALRLANSKAGTGNVTAAKFTFGWIRSEVLGGLINTVFLFALCFSVLVDSLKLFIVPEKIEHPKPVLIVCCVSLVVNLIGLFMFRATRDNFCQCCFSIISKEEKSHPTEKKSLIMSTKGSPVRKRKNSSKTSTEMTWQNEYQTPHSLNIRGVYLHILEHFLASSIVIVSAIINIYVDHSWTAYVDPSFTLLVVLMILHSTIPLFRETIILFMQSVPANIKVDELQERLIRKVPTVLSVHEFHIWQLGGSQVVASAHILFKKPEDYQNNSSHVKAFFHNEGIGCMTFQPEFIPEEFRSMDLKFTDLKECYYSCSNDESCAAFTCCGMEQNGNVKCVNNTQVQVYETGV